MALGTYLGHKQEWIKDVLSSDTGVLHLSVVSGNYGVPVSVHGRQSWTLNGVAWAQLYEKKINQVAK